MLRSYYETEHFFIGEGWNLRVPIQYKGERIGFLDISQQGLMTIFEAHCQDRGELLRLSVYGENGREGYLGVMVPGGGKLHLRRSLSRMAMRSFPTGITHAGPAGQRVKQKPLISLPAPEEKPNETKGEMTEATAQSGAAGHADDKRSACASGEETSKREEEVLWRRSWDGSLTASWQGRDFMALPTSEDGLVLFRPLERRVIEGRHYLVFEIKDGEIL